MKLLVDHSPIPDQLRDLGYVIEQVSQSQRILGSAIVEQFTRGPRGELELLTPGSTEPVVETRTHEGIVRVAQFEFDIP